MLVTRITKSEVHGMRGHYGTGGLPLRGEDASAAGCTSLEVSQVLPTANGMRSDFMEPCARDLAACSEGQVAVQIIPAGTQPGNPARLQHA